jgi:hypothetical protein
MIRQKTYTCGIIRQEYKFKISILGGAFIKALKIRLACISPLNGWTNNLQRD